VERISGIARRNGEVELVTPRLAVSGILSNGKNSTIFIAEGGHITRQVKEVKGLEKVDLMGADGIFSPDFYKAA
jgi:hypothetical protein